MELTKHWAAELDDYVIDLAWSPDGTTVAAASAAGPVTLFTAHDGANPQALPGHEAGTNGIAWRPELAGPLSRKGDVLATGGQDGSVKFWDSASGQHTGTAVLGRGWIEHLGWRPATDKEAPVLAAAIGRMVAFLNPDGSVRHTAVDAPKTISALEWRPSVPERPLLAFAYFGGVHLIDGIDFSLKKALPYGNGIQTLKWSPDGRWLVSGNQDPSVHLWLPDEDAELQMSGYESKVKHLSFDHTSRWLATSGGREACVWDCSGTGPEGREPAMLPHDQPVCGVAFQRSHGLLATAASDGAVMLWSPERKQPLRATVRMPSAATRLSWSPDDRYLAIGSEKGVVYVLKCET
jgi:WD40 repeat protein